MSGRPAELSPPEIRRADAADLEVAARLFSGYLRFYGNKEAGAKYWAMLQKGQSQPWQLTLKELTGGEQMDASAILDYFAPLQAWLKEQNQGKTCGW